jgi:hypothetical protein
MGWFGSDAVEVTIKLSDLLIQHGACVEELQSYEWGKLLFNPNIEFQRPSENSHAQERLCKYRISISSDIEARNNASQTALLYSAYYWHPGSVNWLRSFIANGAALTARDAKGRGPFHQMFVGFVGITRLYGTHGIVKRYRVFEAKAKILLDAGSDPFQRDLEGHLPACFGCDRHMQDLWQSVLRKGIGREVTSGECFCKCGGLYELADFKTEPWERRPLKYTQYFTWVHEKFESLRRWKNGYKRGDVKMEEEGRGESRAGLGELGQGQGVMVREGEELQTKHVSEEDDGFEADEDLEGDEDWTGDEDREEDEGSEEEGDSEEDDNLEDRDSMEVDTESEQDEEPDDI